MSPDDYYEINALIVGIVAGRDCTLISTAYAVADEISSALRDRENRSSAERPNEPVSILHPKSIAVLLKFR
jgi:hypothetical protein